MAEAVYILCAATSVACAVLLLRGYARSRARFLLWSSLCFVGLGLNNALLVLDKMVLTNDNLSVWRTTPAVAGLALLLFGLIWDAE
jgi:hypothetical protein